jgi:SAM-dependent methyltransferase
MNEYEASTYDQRTAEMYDELYGEFDPASVELLAELAGEGTALELGIGTGRIALPLREKGISVGGIDASDAMLSKLRTKPAGDEIEVWKGSFTKFSLGKRFSLIYVVFNTFFDLLTQEAQVRCFKSVKQHLSPTGVFLIEAFVPDLCRYIDGQTVRALQWSEQGARLEVSQVDPLAQQVTSQHVLLAEGGIRLFPVKLRYAWPSELDLMAQLAGLVLHHRWGSWSREAFTKDSQKHISVYGL